MPERLPGRTPAAPALSETETDAVAVPPRGTAPGTGPRTGTGNAGEEAAGTDGAHRTTTVERGSFSSAVCSCGWRGPARRARDRARADGAGHLAATPFADTPK